MSTSAWGLSFGAAWGDSFRAGTTPPPPPPASDVTKWGNPWLKERLRKEQEDEMHYITEQNETVVAAVLALLAAGELA